jgi:energy-coupling factor transporter ATP-binding protein EcfA2
MIILVAGKKGSGKDTLANLLKDLINDDKHVQRLSFAEPIKEVSNLLFGWDYAKFDQDDKETVDKNNGVSPRDFWQWFGTEVMQYAFPRRFKHVYNKMGRNIWVKILADKANKPGTTYIVSDWRFPHELDYLLKNTHQDVVAIRIDRKDLNSNDLHESESVVDELMPMFIVENTSTLEELKLSAETLLEDIRRIYDRDKREMS